MLTELDAHGDASDPEPFAGPDHPIRKLTRAVAFGKEWKPEHAERMSVLFNELAPNWSTDHVDATKAAPVRDALERGGVPMAGSWLEVLAPEPWMAGSGRLSALICRQAC